MTRNDIENYFEKYNEDIGNKISSSEEYSLLANPFYLISVIDYYKSNNSLPENNAELYKYLIDKSFEVDESRRYTTSSIIPLKESGWKLLEKIAFCIQIMQSQSISFSDLTIELGLTTNDIELCCQFTIFKRENGDKFSFIHNAFREYFVANKFSTYSFEKLKEIICYTDTKIIRPAFYNVVLLLVSILNRESNLFKSLVNFLADNEKDLLFTCEKHNLGNTQIFEIFKAYFEYHKQNFLFIPRHLTVDIMDFADSFETVNYLVDEVKSEKCFSKNLKNAYSLLCYADFSCFSLEKKNEIKKVFLENLGKYKDEKDNGDYVINLFHSNLFNGSEIKDIYKVIEYSESPTVLFGFYELLKNKELLDDYIDWIISKNKFIGNYYTADGVTHVFYRGKYYEVLSHLKKHESIIKVLGNIFNNIPVFSSFEEDSFKENKILLLEKLSEFSLKDNSDIIGGVTKLLMEEAIHLHHEPYYLQLCKIYRDFFIRAGVDEEIFEIYFQVLKKYYINTSKEFPLLKCLNVLIVLITDSRLDRILNDVDLKEKQKAHFTYNLCFYDYISSNFNWVEKINNSLYNNREEALVQAKKKYQEGFDILFNKTRLLEDVVKVFEKYPIIKKKSINIDTLYASVNETILSLLIQNFTKEADGTIVYNLQHIVSQISNEDEFYLFIIRRLRFYLEDIQSISISGEQQKKLIDYINHGLNNIKPKSLVEDLVVIISSLRSREIDFYIEDNLLLKFLPYCSLHYKPWKIDNSNNSFSYLSFMESNMNDKTLLFKEIDSVFESEEIFNMNTYLAISQHMVQNNYTKYYSRMVDFLERKDIVEQYPNFQYSMMKEIGKLDYDFLRKIRNRKENWNNQTILCYYDAVLKNSELLKLEKDEIKQELENLYSNIEISLKVELIFLLLKLGSSKGLEWYIMYLKESEDEFYKIFSVEKFDYNDKDGLIEILNIGIERDDDSLINMIQETLFNLAMKSKEQREEIFKCLRDIANEDLKNRGYIIKNIQNNYRKYYEVNSPEVTIKEALDYYKYFENTSFLDIQKV